MPTDVCLSDDVDNYGDPFDTMGNRSPWPSSARCTSELNMLAPGAIATAPTGTSKYRLYASDVPGAAGPRLLVSRGATGSSTTSRSGARTRSSASARELGGQRRVDPIVGCRGTVVTSNDDTVLIDMERRRRAAGTRALMPGRVYSDPANGVRISVDSVANPWAVVTVTRPCLTR